MQYLIYSHSSEETQQIGRQFATLWQPGTILALHGNLGAGKTTWTRGLVEGLGLDTQAYSSPTFTICHSYRPQVDQQALIPVLHHLDVYRLSGAEEFHSAGLQELLETEGNCVLEWAERIADLLPPTCWELHIDRVDERRQASLEIIPSNCSQSNQEEDRDWLSLSGEKPLDLTALLSDRETRRLLLTVPERTVLAWAERGLDPIQWGYQSLPSPSPQLLEKKGEADESTHR